MCLSLDMPVRTLCDRNRARLADRRARESFALNFFAVSCFFSPHEVWSTLKFVVYSKTVVEYRHPGADEIAYIVYTVMTGNFWKYLGSKEDKTNRVVSKFWKFTE